MTVRDLIAKLETMPPDAVVVFQLFSECVALGGDDPSLDAMIERHGTYMRFNEKRWDYARDGQPKLLQVCRFPGN